MNRISRDEWGMQLAEATALRSTCVRRHVGCVAVDINGVVLSTGYNGPARRFEHCIEHPCPGAELPSGEGLDICQALHAEQNCVAFCPDAQRINTVYITTSPCMSCAKLLLATGCQFIVFHDLYQEEPLALWNTAGRTWKKNPRPLLVAG